MGKSIGWGSSLMVVAGMIGAMALYPAVGYAGDMAGSAKHTISFTKDYTASSWTSQTGWSNRAVHKLGFGAKNLLLGWTDLFTEPAEEKEAGGSLLKGIGIGLKDGVENMVGGAVHIVTFPITCLDYTLPEGGVQLGS